MRCRTALLRILHSVMAGLAPPYDSKFALEEGVDARDELGHDGVSGCDVHHCPSRSISAGACTWSAL